MDNAPSLNRYAYANENPYRYWDPTGFMSKEFIGIYKQDEADREAEYFQLVKTKGPDAPITKQALAQLTELRATIADLEQSKDFEDNVAIPVVQEVDQMVVAGYVGAAAATVKVGRYALYCASVVGGVSGVNEAIEGVKEGDPWRVVGGVSTAAVSAAVAIKSSTSEVVEDAKGLLGKVKSFAKRLVGRSGIAPVAVTPDGFIAPVPTAGAPEPVDVKPMQVAKSPRGGTSGSSEGGTVRVRHFTNSKGVKGIESEGVIRASDQNKVFTVKAKGKPGSPRDVEETLGIKRGRGNNYVESDANPEEFQTINNPRTGATETVFESDVDLSGRNATFHKNR